jgi:hypothetical protein
MVRPASTAYRSAGFLIEYKQGNWPRLIDAQSGEKDKGHRLTVILKNQHIKSELSWITSIFVY